MSNASKLSLFSRYTDVSGSASWESSAHRLVQFREVTVDVTGANHHNQLHFDQAREPGDLSDATRRYRQSHDVHEGEHRHINLPVTHEYGRIVYEETTGTDTSGLNVVSYAHPVASALSIHQLSKNIYTATTVSAGTLSDPVDVLHYRTFDLFGSSQDATTLTPYISCDASGYYPHGQQVTLASAGNFHMQFSSTARYVKVHSSANATLTVDLTGM